MSHLAAVVSFLHASENQAPERLVEEAIANTSFVDTPAVPPRHAQPQPVRRSLTHNVSIFEKYNTSAPSTPTPLSFLPDFKSRVWGGIEEREGVGKDGRHVRRCFYSHFTGREAIQNFYFSKICSPAARPQVS